MGKLTASDINALRGRAIAANLDGLSFLAGFSDAQIAEVYNGIGPAFLPAKKREKLSKYLDLFAPAAVIHDMRYEMADGTRTAYDAANFEFRVNCYTLAELRYGGLDWRRCRAYAAAEALYKAVASLGGWLAYIDAQRKRRA